MTTNAKHWSALRIRISCDSVVTMTVWQDTINCYRGSVNELYELCNKYIKFPETLTEVNSLIATYINLFHIKFFYKSKYLPLYFLCLIILLKYCPWHHLSVKRGHMEGRHGRRCNMFYVAGTLTTLPIYSQWVINVIDVNQNVCHQSFITHRLSIIIKH